MYVVNKYAKKWIYKCYVGNKTPCRCSLEVIWYPDHVQMKTLIYILKLLLFYFSDNNTFYNIYRYILYF